MPRTRLVLPLVVVLLLAAARPEPVHAGVNIDPYYTRQWGLHQLRAPTAWTKATGAGVVIAIVDSGVDAQHPEFAGRLLSGASWVDCGNGPVPCSRWDDAHGHGTAVAGVAAAPDDNRGIIGIAPDAMILPVRVLDHNNTGVAGNVAAGIRWAADRGAHVINVSIGGPPGSGPVLDLVGLNGGIAEAAEYALNKNVLVVFAAGNESTPVCANESLTTAAGALCVGAVDRRGLHAPYSNFGHGIDVVAAGGVGSVFCDHDEEDVLSTWPLEKDECDDGRAGYTTAAGTSLAAPHVSGVAALLAQRGVRGRAAGSRIRATAADLGVPGPDPLYGAGLVDAVAALQ